MNTYRASRNYQDHLRECRTNSRTNYNDRGRTGSGSHGYQYGDGKPPKLTLNQLCGHQECYTRIDGWDYMLHGCLKAKLYVPRTKEKQMLKKYTKINKYLHYD